MSDTVIWTLTTELSTVYMRGGSDRRSDGGEKGNRKNAVREIVGLQCIVRVVWCNCC